MTLSSKDSSYLLSKYTWRSSVKVFLYDGQLRSIKVITFDSKLSDRVLDRNNCFDNDMSSITQDRTELRYVFSIEEAAVEGRGKRDKASASSLSLPGLYCML